MIVCGCADRGAIIDLPAPDQKQEQEQQEPQEQEPAHEWDANRGKIVTPSGADWTSKTIDDGVVYYTYTATGSTKLRVYAIDVDLSKTQYDVKLVYTRPDRKYPSQVFAETPGAVAVMNANYEVTSIYIRVDGSEQYCIPNTIIKGTSVPNWKSEAAFVSDRHRNIKLDYFGSINKGKTIQQQRDYYSSLPNSTSRDIISSAPMLIDDFEPVGLDFCDYTLTDAQVKKLNSEDLNSHQRNRNPRSAVALTENGHFIMLIVDGRSTTSVGMSARELTNFFVKYFNPQYALNMDGGGSTAMCVKGEGNAESHVVNTPCETSNPSKWGERPRDVCFAIVKNN